MGILDNIFEVMSPLIKRTNQDKGIPYLRPSNRAQPFLHLQDNIQTRIVAVVEIRTTSNFIPYTIPEIQGDSWNLHQPFHSDNGVQDLIYWKYLGDIKIDQATRIIAREVCDYMYRLIYKRRKPIIGVRVILIDWNTGKPIDPDLLQDKWFASNGFNGYKIDKWTLKHWGIDIGDVSPESNQRMEYRYSVDNEFKTNEIDGKELERLFIKYHINLSELAREALTDIRQKLPKNLDNNSYNRLKSRLQTFIMSTAFKRRVNNTILRNLKEDRKFRDKFVTSDDKVKLIKETVYSILEVFIKEK